MHNGSDRASQQVQSPGRSRDGLPMMAPATTVHPLSEVEAARDPVAQVLRGARPFPRS